MCALLFRNHARSVVLDASIGSARKGGIVISGQPSMQHQLSRSVGATVMRLRGFHLRASAFRRVIKFGMGVARHPREVDTFIRFNFPRATSDRLSFGTLEGDVRKRLIELAAECSGLPGPIVELGSLFGHSAQAICEGKSPKTVLVCVDAYLWNPYGLSRDRHEELLRLNLDFFIKQHSVRLESVSSNAQFFTDWADEIPSMVFIDAGHFYEEVKADIKWALGVGARVICGDDYHFPGVQQAVRELLPDVRVTAGKFWEYKAPPPVE